MSKAYNSPTARLLQSSRLFSLPRPLPQPALETQSTGGYRASETATQYYPTHQAISTPASSHSRGDWGLKRAIPGKTTRSSTPSIRVLGQDTSDHITEFESAADHERTRAKWAEMGIPIMARGDRGSSYNRATKRMSAYEPVLDNTDPKAGPVVVQSDDLNDPNKVVNAKRWKHTGPFIAGMKESEFQHYVEKQLRARRAEWNDYLMDFFARESFENERRAALKNGQLHGPLEFESPVNQVNIITMEATNRADSLRKQAAATEDADEKATLMQEAERIVTEARQDARPYELEVRRLEAPNQAQNLILDARRALATEAAEIASLRGSIGETEGNSSDATETVNEQIAEIEAKMASIQAAAVEDVHRVLDTESTDSLDLHEAESLIQSVRNDYLEAQVEKARAVEAWNIQRTRELRPSLEKLAELEKGLRDGHDSLSSPLTMLITDFLDIPSVSGEIEGGLDNIFGSSLGRHAMGLLNNSEEPPPTTHPAAGLSHIRTNAFMENHPIHGPQATSSPVLSRVLAARNSLGKQTSATATIGVGGFVTQDSKVGSGLNSSIPRRYGEQDPAHALDPDLPHGNKIYVNPRHAIVDEAGRVRLTVERSDPEAIAVKEGNVDDIKRARVAGANRPSAFVGLPSRPPSRSHARYGTGLPRRAPAEQSAPVQSRVSGFDAELGQQGDLSEDSTMAKIKELSEGARK